jgi:hypothetical protein
MKIFLLMAIMCFSAAAHADIYKCTDDAGQPAFADGKTKISYKGCILILHDDLPPPRRNSGNIKTVSARASTPSDFPRVDRQTQYQRDDKRKQILVSELESELNALQDAKKTYAEGLPTLTQATGRDASSKVSTSSNNFDEKTQRLQADVSSHEKNIQLLQKELNALR